MGFVFWLALGIVTGWTQTPKLFLPPSIKGSGPHSSDFPSPGNLATQTQLARLNPSGFAALRATGEVTQITLELNLFTNADYRVTLDRREVLGPHRILWRGTVDESVDSQVILAINGSAMAGSVFVPGRGNYQIQQAGEEFLRLSQISADDGPTCNAVAILGPSTNSEVIPPAGHTNATNATNATSASIARTPSVSLADASPSNRVVIDLLVVYTKAAKEGAGGLKGVQALIDNAVAEANIAFENSHVPAQLRLVHSDGIDYDELGNISDDLNNLEKDGEREDSPIQGVRQLRAIYRADLVCLLTERSDGPYGLAYLMHQVDPKFAHRAFSVVQRAYANSYFALAHELGHNMGCQHDRPNASGPGAFPYSYAHRLELDGIQYHTVMAYQPGLPIPYFSSPYVLFQGLPTGIQEAETNSANNALTLQQTVATVSQFDAYIPTGQPPHISISAPLAGEIVLVDSTNLTITVTTDDDDGMVEFVEFFANGQSLGESRHRPFQWTWTNAVPGEFQLTARARNDWKLTTLSSPVRLRFVRPSLRLDATNSSRRLDGAFQLRVQGNLGQTIRLETSSNLVHWAELGTYPFKDRMLEILDLQATNTSIRFYRARLLP